VLVEAAGRTGAAQEQHSLSNKYTTRAAMNDLFSRENLCMHPADRACPE
jgi:hypothetical protein